MLYASNDFFLKLTTQQYNKRPTGMQLEFSVMPAEKSRALGIGDPQFSTISAEIFPVWLAD